MLAEGMRRHDLRDLVLPLVSIDEYESKIDKSAIVVGFYVHDQNAAQDLNRFLQKSTIDMLDTDISPAPDQHGFFMVFVELWNNDTTPRNIIAMTDDVKNLTGIKKWQMRIRDDRVRALESAAIRRHLSKERERDDISEERIYEFLKPSMLHSVRIDEDMVYLDGTPVSVVDFGAVDALLERYGLAHLNIDLDEHTLWHDARLRQRLGEGWHCDKIGAFRLLHRGGDSGLLIRD